jgi:hypothetical protein
MTVGRPLKFKTPKEIEDKANEYFNMCDEKGKPYTITGLAIALDTDRKTLINYGEKEEFFHTIKKVKQIVLKNMDKIQLKNPIIPREEYKVPKVKEIKLEKEIIPEKKGTNQLHKSKFTQKTENDYNLMMKQLKNKNYKNNEEHVIKKLISADDKILSKENNNKPKRKELINDFLQRNQDYIEYGKE